MERIDVEQWRGREVARLLALVETERRYYQEMVAALPVALAVLSADNTIVSANRAFRDAFSLSSDEVRRRKIDYVLPRPELLEKIKQARESSVQSPSSYLPVGEKLYRVAVIPFRNWDDASEIETLLMIFDVTDIAAEKSAHAPEPAVTPAAPAAHPTPIAEQGHLPAPAPEHIAAPQATTEEPLAITPEEHVAVTPEEHVAIAPEESVAKAKEPAAAEDLAASAEAEKPVAPVSAPPKPSPLLAEYMPAVLWLANASDLTFTHVSDSSVQILGHTPADWTSNPRFFSERIHLEDRDAVMALYRAAVQHGQEVSAEFRMHNAAGNVIWCRETFRPLPTGAVSGVLTPVGARKQMEQQRVTMERHSALQNLSAQLAHDLNNPLMIVTGYAEELLHHTPSDDPRRGDLEEILRASQRISGITSQLLNFTRRPEPSPQPLNLARIVRDLKPQTDQIAGSPDMVYLNADEPVWALAERAPFEQIVLALVRTVHEAPAKMVALLADTVVVNEQVEAATLGPGTYARITIRNDGPGMDAAKKAAIFESIVVKDSVVKDNVVKDNVAKESGAKENVAKERAAFGPSTAGALAQAYALVHAWGGDITFSSDNAQGSVFTILLPLADAPVVQEMPASAPHPVEMPRTTSGETILVVDDEPGIRALVAKILRRERYDVIEAGSATEAGSAVSAHPTAVRLLLTDVMLPDRSGRHVAEQLSESLPDLRVLYISGFTDDESVRAGNFPPGSLFLQKPFTVGALIAKVREALDQ